MIQSAKHDKIARYKDLISKLPIAHRNTLQKFMQHLNELV